MINFVIFIISGFGFVFGSETLGHLVLHRLQIPSSQHYSVISTGLGIIFITFILILLGLLGIYTPLSMWIVLFIWLGLAIFGIASKAYEYKESHTHSIQESELDFIPMLLRVSVLVMLSVYFVSVMTPETRHDPYDYHLTVPTIYLANGGIVEIPWHVFTYMPKNGELLYGLAIGVGNDSIAKLMHFAFGCLCIGTMATFMQCFFSRISGLLSALLIAALPLFGFLATSSYIDLIRAYWELLSLFCLALFWRNDEQHSTLWLFLSVLFAGMALGTKYVAWLIFLIPYLMLICTCIVYQKDRIKAWMYPLMIILFVLPFLPWLILNQIWTVNPFYPLFPSIFGMHTPAAQQAYTFFKGHAPPADVYTFTSIISYAFMRLHRLILEGNALVIIGLAGMITYPLWKKSELARNFSSSIWKGTLIYLIVSGILFVAGSNNEDGRFCFSSIALLSFPASMIVLYLHESARKQSNLVIIVLPLVVVVLLINGLMFRISQIQDLREAIVPIMSENQREEWLARRFPHYPAIQWANDNLPKDAYVLGMGYPLQRKHISGIKFGYIPFLEGIEEDISAKQLASLLKENNITHLAKPFPELPYPADFSVLQPDYLKQIFQYRGLTIFKLDP